MGLLDSPLEIHFGILSFLHSRHDLAKWRCICTLTNCSLQAFRDNLTKRYTTSYESKCVGLEEKLATLECFRWWLQMHRRDDESAMKAGLELFYCYWEDQKAKIRGNPSKEKNARAVVDSLREYLGSRIFAAHFRKALEENKPWPVDISGYISSDCEEAIYLEQASVQALEGIGLSVDSSVKKKWVMRTAIKMDRLNPCATAAFVDAMLSST